MSAFTFKNGVHPGGFKELTRDKSIETVPIPPRVIIPLNQHTGMPLEPLVGRGDRVKTGQVIAEVDAFVSAPVHSSVTGTVKRVDRFPTPVMPMDTCVEIETEETDEFDFEFQADVDYNRLKKKEIVDLIRKSGIVGMGGAAFPASVKFSPPPGNIIDTVILNGCECEPYLTADHRLMIESPETIITGLKIIMKALDVKRGIVGIEDNKPDAIKKMVDLLKTEPEISVRAVKTKYPQGAEKMLIRALTGRKVPPGKLPFHIGIVVSNVGTASAVFDAVVKNKPLYERVVTVTGDGVKQSANLLARIGTPFHFLFQYLGGLSPDAGKILVGGPMMGVAQFSPDVGVTKACSGIVVTGSEKKEKEFNCINCAECVHHCPMFLVPTKIVRYARNQIWDKARYFGALDCIECGCCAYCCPSKIPIVHWIRVAKRKIMEIEKTS
jgi:electron transport complex protein RnfC